MDPFFDVEGFGPGPLVTVGTTIGIGAVVVFLDCATVVHASLVFSFVDSFVVVFLGVTTATAMDGFGGIMTADGDGDGDAVGGGDVASTGDTVLLAEGNFQIIDCISANC